MTTSNKSDTKLCPFCSEEIKATAIKCKHCRSNLLQNQGSPPMETSSASDPPPNTEGVADVTSQLSDDVDQTATKAANPTHTRRRRRKVLVWLLASLLVIGGGVVLLATQLPTGAAILIGDNEETEPPTTSCKQCIKRVCGQCRTKDCVFSRKSATCEVFKALTKADLALRETVQEKRAFCDDLLEQCDGHVANAEEASRPPTPESEPLEFVRARIERARKNISDDRLRRRLLACEVLNLTKLQERRDRITPKMLETRPRRYIGQPIHLDGSVFQIWDRNSRGEHGETEFFVRVRSNVFVIYPEPSDLLQRQRVRVFGYVAGDYSYQSTAGWNLTIPKVIAVSVGSRREMHPYNFHCPRLRRIREEHGENLASALRRECDDHCRRLQKNSGLREGMNHQECSSALCRP